jgi:hypothetical protein
MVVNLLICCLFNDFVSILDNIALFLCVIFLCDMQIKLKPKHVTQCVINHCTSVAVNDCPSSPFLIWHWVRGWLINKEFGRSVEESVTKVFILAFDLRQWWKSSEIPIRHYQIHISTNTLRNNLCSGFLLSDL